MIRFPREAQNCSHSARIFPTTLAFPLERKDDGTFFALCAGGKQAYKPWHLPPQEDVSGCVLREATLCLPCPRIFKFGGEDNAVVLILVVQQNTSSSILTFERSMHSNWRLSRPNHPETHGVRATIYGDYEVEWGVRSSEQDHKDLPRWRRTYMVLRLVPGFTKKTNEKHLGHHNHQI